MSIKAKRSMVLLLAQVDPRRPVPKRIRIDAAEYAEYSGGNPSNAYREIKEGTKELMQTLITTYDSKKREGEQRQVLMWRKYQDAEGWVECSFHLHLLPYIQMLARQGYTKIALPALMSFSRFYTARIFELLMQWESTGERHIEVSEIREILGIPPAKYPRFADFKKRVLLPSIQEIEEKTTWQVSMVPRKKGRQYHSLSFTFKQDPQGRLAL